MTTLLREAGRRIEPSADDGFEVSYVADDCAEHRVPLEQAWAVPLEQFIPVRRFRSRKGQRHLSGLWWSATTGGHVGFESWLERDQVLHLDFDPSVVGIASPPFWLYWTDEAGKPASHAPDFFARRRDDLDRDRRAGPQLKARPHHTARSPGSALPDGTP